MQPFYCSDKNDIHMQTWVTKYKLCKFGDFVYNLNAFIFAFKLAAHDLQIRGKINASNLKTMPNKFKIVFFLSLEQHAK